MFHLLCVGKPPPVFVLNGNCAGAGFAYRVDSTDVQHWILSVIGATEFAKIQFAS